MNGICLINQVRSRMLPYTSKTAEEAFFFSYLQFTFFQLPSIYFFSLTLFRAWTYDNQFSKIKFNLLKILEASQEHTRAMLVKLQAFTPQFNQFHPVCYYQIASLDGYFQIYIYYRTGETTYLSCMIKYLYFMH